MMGRIIEGYSSELVIPASENLGLSGLVNALNVFVERQQQGKKLYPVAVKYVKGTGYVVVDGLKRATIGYVSGETIDLYVADSPNDSIWFGRFPDVHPAVLKGISNGISLKFDGLDARLNLTRKEGISNMSELVKRNRFDIDKAWKTVFATDMPYIPPIQMIQPPQMVA